MEDLKTSDKNEGIVNESDKVERSISEDLVPTHSLKLKKCIYFSKYSYCKFGNKCNFLHDQQFPKQEDRKKSNYSEKSQNFPILEKVFVNRRKLCHYFKAGKCDKGEFCHYQHVFVDNKVLDTTINAVVVEKTKRKRVPICHYFKKGNCQRGETCIFYHHLKKGTNGEEISKSVEETSKEIIDVISETPELNSNSCLPFEPRTVTLLQNKKYYDLPSLSQDELLNLRDTEINQLRKRYPRHTLSEKQSISFTFEPSDPDWRFDVKALDLEIFFPENYPIEVFKIDVLLSSNNIPEMLVRYLNQSISDWINKRAEQFRLASQVELMFRPFLKWFDKNLEDLFICGLRRVKKDIDAKKDGIEYVPVEKLFLSVNGDKIVESPQSQELMVRNELNSQEETPQSNLKEEVIKNHSIFSSKKSDILDNAALKQGIKILFGGLELDEGIATISCNKLAATVQCIRCKTSCNMKLIPVKNSTSKCSKCSKVIECNFSPSIMHQFSNVAGNLHVVECQVADINLVESCFHIDCLNCSKQVVIDGLHYGQKQKRWCMFCNEKMIFSIESVKFQAIRSTYIASKNASVKKTEKRKDPVFKEGEPLPNFGTCKHYKKSYRWLRFPCCGRLYPCDECHDEKELDHEMKFASRMICGFCSKEQPYSKDKACLSCSGSMTAKSGAHWEGGKGCRNKIKMSRDDKHKYVGTSKTVSKKAQSVKAGKKK